MLPDYPKHRRDIISNANFPFLHIMQQTNSFISVRHYSTKLTHVDETGKASMVNVTDKNVTVRTASARAVVKVGDIIAGRIKENSMKKGDVLAIAQVAGITGAKKTSEIIPLCHNIPLTGIKVSAHLDDDQKAVIINATIQSEGKTGVEMEALTAVSAAALTIYDMCKAISRDITITDIILLSKTGGTKNKYKEEVLVRGYETAPIVKEGVFLGGV